MPIFENKNPLNGIGGVGLATQQSEPDSLNESSPQPLPETPRRTSGAPPRYTQIPPEFESARSRAVSELEELFGATPPGKLGVGVVGFAGITKKQLIHKLLTLAQESVPTGQPLYPSSEIIRTVKGLPTRAVRALRDVVTPTEGEVLGVAKSPNNPPARFYGLSGTPDVPVGPKFGEQSVMSANVRPSQEFSHLALLPNTAPKKPKDIFRIEIDPTNYQNQLTGGLEDSVRHEFGHAQIWKKFPEGGAKGAYWKDVSTELANWPKSEKDKFFEAIGYLKGDYQEGEYLASIIGHLNDKKGFKYVPITLQNMARALGKKF